MPFIDNRYRQTATGAREGDKGRGVSVLSPALMQNCHAARAIMHTRAHARTPPASTNAPYPASAPWISTHKHPQAPAQADTSTYKHTPLAAVVAIEAAGVEVGGGRTTAHAGEEGGEGVEQQGSHPA
jgi:hypothetical protein